MAIHSRPPTPLVALLWIALTIGGASIIAFQPSDAPGRGLRVEPDGDSDGDGIVNALDNCLVGQNADQRDSDRDGVGNACDADFNNDGRVDQTDLAALTRAFGTNQRDKDLNGDGAVNRRDLQILLDLFKRGPGPRLDSDGDGVETSKIRVRARLQAFRLRYGDVPRWHCCNGQKPCSVRSRPGPSRPRTTCGLRPR